MEVVLRIKNLLQTRALLLQLQEENESLQEIKRQGGHQFDPCVDDAFLRVVDRSMSLRR
jgi:response regulator RpfG family c-di-GMP phosphodiesterase